MIARDRAEKNQPRGDSSSVPASEEKEVPRRRERKGALLAVQGEGNERMIRSAKTRAWDELIGTMDRDAWGRPYWLVLGKLRSRKPPATEALDRVNEENGIQNELLFDDLSDIPSNTSSENELSDIIATFLT
ncbi:unnamed protein product [Heterotrigona itama]|uniref:Uncharacterized protein n=1 Tax=Heterotrigona itama TaxID=395501 RepID=A0A6V7H9R0_9HYME|nr:unnamed protein product [Heterotrigona itama]